jgi:hypothetical protein
MAHIGSNLCQCTEELHSVSIPHLANLSESFVFRECLFCVFSERPDISGPGYSAQSSKPIYPVFAPSAVPNFDGSDF